MIAAARELAYRAHAGQLYGARPYRDHLEEVAALLAPYGETAVTVGYLHDVLEDTAVTAAELEHLFGAFVTRCVRLLTDPPGASRPERKRKLYSQLANVPPGTPQELALIVKAADRLANVRASRRTDPAKLAMYRSEHPAFRAAAQRPSLAPALWEELDGLLGCPVSAMAYAASSK
jgi:(p)ppGpp synthase/HD superfamily hydrolase